MNNEHKSYHMQKGITQKDLEHLGKNLLTGKPVTIQNAQGEDVGVKHGTPALWTSDFGLGGHLDVLDTAPVDIAYDMEQTISINKLAVMGMGYCFQDYHLGNYVLYLAKDRHRLFDSDNAVIQYEKTTDWNEGEGWLARSVQVFLLDEPVEARFVGIRILQPGIADNLIRFGRLGAYNDRISYRSEFLQHHFDINLLEGIHPTVTPISNVTNLDRLTDGNVFDPSDYCIFRSGEMPLSLTWDMGRSQAIHQLFVAQMADLTITYELFLSENDSTLFDDENRVAVATKMPMVIDEQYPHSAYRLHALYGKSARYFGLRLPKATSPVVLDQIGVYSKRRTVAVDTHTVLCTDFVGVGGNLLPMGLMPNNLAHGFNSAYWELEKQRTKVLRPRVARTWFQIDWMEPEKGVYRFDTEKMQAFYPYLDLYEDAGLEVELNFAWKAGRDIQNWYSFHEKGVKPGNSAPRDIVDFARACVALLRELLVNRGYQQIKYLTYYNEPEANDFDHPGNKQEQAQYYADMANEVHRQLAEAGLRDKIRIWGPEDSGPNAQWFQFMNELAPEAFDGNTFHCYNKPYQRCMDELFPDRNKAAAGRPVYMTEFGWGDENLSNWNAGYTNYVIASANNGFGGCLVWTINGVWLEDPYEDICVAGGNMPLIRAPQVSLKASQSYYEVGLLTRYIDAHSQTMASRIIGADDVRAAAFQTAARDYTVVVECKESFERELIIDFGDTVIGKTFYKFAYKPDVLTDENAMLPPVSACFEVEGTLKDTVDGDYAVMVYTTLKPQTQLKLTPMFNELKPGESVQLSACAVDGDGIAELTWSVVAGNGLVNADGLYTASDTARSGDMVAIRASLMSYPSVGSIALVRIQ